MSTTFQQRNDALFTFKAVFHATRLISCDAHYVDYVFKELSLMSAEKAVYHLAQWCSPIP